MFLLLASPPTGGQVAVVPVGEDERMVVVSSFHAAMSRLHLCVAMATTEARPQTVIKVNLESVQHQEVDKRLHDENFSFFSMSGAELRLHWWISLSVS